MTNPRCVFGEDPGQERDRLGDLERAVDVVSQSVLMEVGVGVGWRCWEVGAGRGSIARWLAGIVGPDGAVLATDLNDEWFDSGGTGVTFQRHDVVRDELPRHSFDLGWNAAYGGELLADLRAVGFREPGGREYRQLAPGGETWIHVADGIRRLEGQLIEKGVTHDQLALVLQCLEDPANLIAGPPVAIAWGRRPTLDRPAMRTSANP